MDDVNNATDLSEDHARTHRSVYMRIDLLTQCRPDPFFAAKETGRCAEIRDESRVRSCRVLGDTKIHNRQRSLSRKACDQGSIDDTDGTCIIKRRLDVRECLLAPTSSNRLPVVLSPPLPSCPSKSVSVGLGDFCGASVFSISPPAGCENHLLEYSVKRTEKSAAVPGVYTCLIFCPPNMFQCLSSRFSCLFQPSLSHLLCL